MYKFSSANGTVSEVQNSEDRTVNITGMYACADHRMRHIVVL